MDPSAGLGPLNSNIRKYTFEGTASEATIETCQCQLQREITDFSEQSFCITLRQLVFYLPERSGQMQVLCAKESCFERSLLSQ